ncbi:MAG: hypothetical protein COV29_01795 [Candidatus Yanofskybacteria bacterium CG10_big_fil_rev_8_21_14_0_10_36_16]|uniref:peptidylprolyl isomerase n=1 Tax=Candidatus Yanofskybacteria bacterium CG10_big_fil_rev_8_21_14_0_10_36_16 TaxID=1975096 RepID=A0A2J0Q7E6_9BACT|nr:MAG: hypothetical protein COV29_01795 [Candidatus Yanofskybacteria bacterium CG10_big_fil_rev_8_21_14_0_10_36_16]
MSDEEKTLEETEELEEDEPQKKSKKKRAKPWVYTLVLVVILIAGALAYTQADNLGDISNFVNKISGVAAEINGEKIKISELELRYGQSLATLESQGLDTTNEEQVKEAKDKTLRGLIRERLVLQEAEKKGIEISQEDVDTFFNDAMENAGGEEAFNKLLSDNNVSEEQFKSNIKNQLTAQEYIKQISGEELTASEEEVNAFYEQLKAQGAEAPPLEDVREDIVRYIENQKLNQILASTIDQLEEGADIEIYF